MRISKRILETRIKTLNKITGNPIDAIKDCEWQIGSFCLSSAYGGYALDRVSNSSGGINQIFNTGHIPARELLGRIDSFIDGILFQKELIK